MKLNKQKVKELLPQKEPFRFVDSVEDVDENNKTIRCNYTFKDDNPVFQGHFPNKPIVPGVLLIEAIAQSAILLMTELEENKGCSVENEYFLSKVEEIKFKKPLFPNQKATIVSKMERTVLPFYFFSSIIYNRYGHKILEGRIIVFKNEYDR